MLSWIIAVMKVISRVIHHRFTPVASIKGSDSWPLLLNSDMLKPDRSLRVYVMLKLAFLLNTCTTSKSHVSLILCEQKTLEIAAAGAFLMWQVMCQRIDKR